jgi:hypothetical protein
VSALERISSIEFTQQHKILAYLLQPDRKGWCAIHLAAKSGYLKSLLDQAKRAGIKGDNATVSKFVQSFIGSLKKHETGRIQIMDVICGGMLTSTGLTPIHIAISNRRSDMLEVLLRNPITDVILKNQRNAPVLIKPRYTALDLAIKNKDGKAVLLLLKKVSPLFPDIHVQHCLSLLASIASSYPRGKMIEAVQVEGAFTQVKCLAG